MPVAGTLEAGAPYVLKVSAETIAVLVDSGERPNSIIAVLVVLAARQRCSRVFARAPLLVNFVFTIFYFCSSDILGLVASRFNCPFYCSKRENWHSGETHTTPRPARLPTECALTSQLGDRFYVHNTSANLQCLM